jgi:hypothetical protein
LCENSVRASGPDHPSQCGFKRDMIISVIRNRLTIDSFENSFIRRSVPDFQRNLRIFESLYREACSLGVLPLKDPLDGIQSDIHLARILNVRKPA